MRLGEQFRAVPLPVPLFGFVESLPHAPRRSSAKKGPATSAVTNVVVRKAMTLPHYVTTFHANGEPPLSHECA